MKLDIDAGNYKKRIVIPVRKLMKNLVSKLDGSFERGFNEMSLEKQLEVMDAGEVDSALVNIIYDIQKILGHKTLACLESMRAVPVQHRANAIRKEIENNYYFYTSARGIYFELIPRPRKGGESIISLEPRIAAMNQHCILEKRHFIVLGSTTHEDIFDDITLYPWLSNEGRYNPDKQKFEPYTPQKIIPALHVGIKKDNSGSKNISLIVYELKTHAHR